MAGRLMTISSIDPKTQAQMNEFAAVRKVCKAFSALPPIVDNDYPEMRHYYEREVRILINAFKANGRFGDSK